MRLSESAESALEYAAAASLASCVALSGWLAAPVVGVNPLPVMVGGGALGFFGVIAGFRRAAATAYPVPAFALAPIEIADLDELLLTETLAIEATDRRFDELVLTLEQRLRAERHTEHEADVLLLDDMLAQIGPDSRVVRLFDPAAIPTPGALRSRIDRHLQDQQSSGHPDAAQALNDALADLRRSLR